MYFVKSPYLLKRFFAKNLIWEIPTQKRKLYLTFDDGPTPGVTHEVLAILEEYEIKASFFCVGEMVMNHPDILADIVNSGHAVGNHTYKHLNGWKTELDKYIENVSLGAKYVKSDFFRPPYGKITTSQINALKDKYFIIMWSVLSYDFDMKTSKEQCLENVVSTIKPGAIIVFHDSKKSAEKMLYALPRFIEEALSQGYTFEIISRSACSLQKA